MSEPDDLPPGEEPTTAAIPADAKTGAEATDDLAAVIAKGAEIDRRLDRLEAETTPAPHNPATIGTMAGD